MNDYGIDEVEKTNFVTKSKVLGLKAKVLDWKIERMQMSCLHASNKLLPHLSCAMYPYWEEYQKLK